MQDVVRDKPGIGVEKHSAFPRPTAPVVSDLPGALPRGPLRKPKEGYRHLGLQITADLYAKVVDAAKAEGSGTSVFVRRVIADRLGEAAAHDRLDGVRVPPAELAGLSVALGHTTQLVLASRDLSDGQAAGAVMALERAHDRLVKIIERLER